MTTEERKMKRYCNAVARRLTLPRQVKNRVMNDFTTTIAALRESGRTDREICAQLGTPREAAAVLNEQMKDFAYRKSPWRFLGLTAAVGCGLLMAFTAGTKLLASLLTGGPGADAVGIIGGADGPTTLFVATSSGIDWDMVLLLALMVLGLIAWWCLGRCKPKQT